MPYGVQHGFLLSLQDLLVHGGCCCCCVCCYWSLIQKGRCVDGDCSARLMSFILLPAGPQPFVFVFVFVLYRVVLCFLCSLLLYEIGVHVPVIHMCVCVSVCSLYVQCIVLQALLQCVVHVVEMISQPGCVSPQQRVLYVQSPFVGAYTLSLLLVQLHCCALNGVCMPTNIGTNVGWCVFSTTSTANGEGGNEQSPACVVLDDYYMN